MGERKARPNLFGDIREENVTFLIDTSGSMYCRLELVKQHLREALQQLAAAGDRKFNLIEFNSKVVQWADQMVKCLPETIRVAFDWISSLEAKTGTNTEAALLAAFNDSECDAVYIVTDGLPDSQAEYILDRVAYVCNGRPTHCTYLTGANVDKSAVNFLQDLATETFGSFQIVTVTNHGSIEKTTPVYKASHSGTGVIRTVNRKVFSGNQKQCSVTTTIDGPPPSLVATGGLPYNPYTLPFVPPGSALKGPHPGVTYPMAVAVPPAPRVYADETGSVLRVPYFTYAWSQWYQPYLWARYRTARSWLKLPQELDGSLAGMTLSPAAGAMLIDQPVLARRTSDGLFYRGRVKSQISVDQFLVEFSPCTNGKFLDTTYQETLVFDIVQLADAKRHSIMKGDKVLAPLGGSGDLYCPGVVIDGQEIRECHADNKNKELVVMFANGRSSTIQFNLAARIDQLLYDRAAFELKLPKKVRQQIVDTVAKYPEDSFPGYPVSGADRDPEEWELPRKLYVEGPEATYEPHTGLRIHKEDFENYAPYLRNISQKSSVTREHVESKIPGTNLTRSELERKVDAQIAAHHEELDKVTDTSRKRSREGSGERRRSENQQVETADSLQRDIEILEAEIKYKMNLREKAIDQKKCELDNEIDQKIKEREKVMQERRLLLTRRPYSALESYRDISEDRDQKVRSRAFPETTLYSTERTSRSRTRSSSEERTPRSRFTSPYHERSRSISPSLTRSVDFDDSLNRKYYYQSAGSKAESYDSGYSESDTRRDSATNTPTVRNGRVLTLKREKEHREPWRYWKAEPIPNIVGPPTHDPYSTTAVAEPLELRETQIRTGALEWGSSHFNNVVPNGHTNYQRYSLPYPPMKRTVCFEQRLPSSSSLAPSSNLVSRQSKEEKKLALRQHESQRRLNDPSKYYISGDSVGAALQDQYRERVQAQLERTQAKRSAEKNDSKHRSAARTNPQHHHIQHYTASYQNELHARSHQLNGQERAHHKDAKATYEAEVRTRKQHNDSLTRQQRKIATKSAQQLERNMLLAAKLVQDEATSKQALKLKRDIAQKRDSKHEKHSMAESAGRRVLISTA